MAEKTGTEFTNASQTNGGVENNAGPSSLKFPLMSPEGSALAQKSAPDNAFKLSNGSEKP